MVDLFIGNVEMGRRCKESKNVCTITNQIFLQQLMNVLVILYTVYL
jgi:hypothetical protein